MHARHLLMPAIGVFAVVTGLLAWRAGYFSFKPEFIAPSDDAVVIQGIDQPTTERVAEKLVLTGFIKQGSRFVAIIDDQVVEVGEVLLVSDGPTQYRLLVNAISSVRVVLSLVEPDEKAA